MFYNSFAKSIIIYGLLAYGSAVKWNLIEIQKAKRRILQAVFFRKKPESIRDILSENKILTIFESNLLEVLKEVFKQLPREKPGH